LSAEGPRHIEGPASSSDFKAITGDGYESLAGFVPLLYDGSRLSIS
jgi:hypothetical protein